MGANYLELNSNNIKIRGIGVYVKEFLAVRLLNLQRISE